MSQPDDLKSERFVAGVEIVDGNDAWALFTASARGDSAEVKELLAKDVRLANAQYWYQLPIHLAVYAGHAEIVKFLLAHGADPGQSIYTYNSWDKLLACAREREESRIEKLLVRAMQQRFRYDPGFDPLKAAIIAHDPKQISLILRRHPELVQASDALGNNPLHWSVLTRQLHLIKRFVELGTAMDALRADGQTPLLLAVNGATDYWYRDTRGRNHASLRNASVIVGALLAYGAEYTLSVAAAVGDQEQVERLLQKKPELATQLDSSRGSPLAQAAANGHAHIVRLLLERGADPNLPEAAAPDGAALFSACCGNHLEIAQLLLEHGANPNAGTDSNGCCLTICEVYHGKRARPLQALLRKHGAYSPPYDMSTEELKEAIRAGHEVIHHQEFLGNVMQKRDAALLELYLDSDPTIVSRMDYWSGLVYPKSAPLIRTLLSRGLDPNQADWLGKTYLHACAEQGDRSAAAIFLDAGADINARDIEFQGTPLAAAVRAYCAAKEPTNAERTRSMIKFLLKRGAALDLPGDKAWATPLAWARRAGTKELVQLLTQSS
jgi:ankyrin repeat protein